MWKRKARRANHAGEGWIPVRISLCALGLQQASNLTEHSVRRYQPRAIDWLLNNGSKYVRVARRRCVNQVSNLFF